MKYSDDTLKSWTAPLSQTEEQRVQNTIKMIKDSVSACESLSNFTVEIFAQGSYANNTNVRQNSDIDVCVMLTSTVFCNYVEGKANADYGYTDGEITYIDYKSHIVKALTSKFGDDAVTIGNKSINIKSTTYRVNADVVPAFQYRDFRIISSSDPSRYVEGIKFLAKDGTEVINYPKDHINNGKQKNNNTNHEYKKLVRIMKHIRNNMVDAQKTDGDKITSFLVECLVWNVPNDVITKNNTWEGTVRNTISYLWEAISEGKHQKWGEVSERLYLFHSGRKWTAEETKTFLYNMYNYLEFE